VSAEGGTKAVLAALTANLAIAIAKFGAFAVTGSTSMAAEGVHSLADSGNQVLLLVGGKRSRRTATQEHPFGFGRARYVYAFIVSIVLFTLGGLFALYEGWHKVTHPEELNSLQWAIGVLIFAIVAESFSLRTAVKESNRVRGSARWVRFVRSNKSPELPVVLLEDVGALIGLVFALVGVSLAAITGNSRWDGLGSMAIGLLLVAIAVFLAIEMNSLLLGEAALPEHVAAIESALVSGKVFTRVIHLRTLHLGPDEILVAAKVGVTREDSAESIASAIDAAESQIRAAVPLTCVIYLEPDLYDLRNIDATGRAPSADA